MDTLLVFRRKNDKLNPIGHFLDHIPCTGKSFFIIFHFNDTGNFRILLFQGIRYQDFFPLKKHGVKKICKALVITPEIF